MKHLIEPLDFTTEEIDDLLRLAYDIFLHPNDFSDKCSKKLLASLFFEPSTRTRLSFESAMIRLGGSVVGFSDSNSSSTTKGESLVDTLKVVENYVDIIAMRHPKEGSAKLASKYIDVPIINAGDGGHFHPTQTLTDLMTIKYYKKDLNNLKIGFCGDLKFGRTIHSLVRAMNRYKNIEFVFISPEELKMPEQFLEDIDSKYIEIRNLEDSLIDLDVLYMSRVQKERFVSSDEYERLKDFYILDSEKLKNAREDLIIMHPLPRVNEISREVDDDKRAVYFEQTKFGMYVRMALIMYLLGVK